MFYAFASGDCRPLAEALPPPASARTSASGASSCGAMTSWISVGSSEVQRQTVFETFAPDKDMCLYGRGIRRRLATMLGGDQRRIELAYSLLFTLPGTPVLRYGDEIGMGDDLSLPERQAVRTPMQWTADRHAGFSGADTTVLPAVREGPFGYQRVNVAEQRRDPGSLLNCTERLIRLRKECPEFGWGDAQVLRTGSPHVLAVLATWRHNAVIAVHNFAPEACEATFVIPGAADVTLTNLLTPEHSTPDQRGRHTLALEPYGYRWFRVGPLLDLITREPR